MTTTPTPPPGGASAARRPRRRDRTPVAWLLVVPLLLTLYPPLYNRLGPELFGVPFFYWYQLAIVPVGVAATWLVYRATRS